MIHRFFEISNLKKIFSVFFSLLIVLFMSKVITQKAIKKQPENVQNPITARLNKLEVHLKPKETTNAVKEVTEPLGSIRYVEKIREIAKKSGNRTALSVIMIDVDKNENELDSNKPSNISRLHILISELINRIGHVDMQTNYFRNKLNRAPKTLKELILLNKTLTVNKRWILLNIQNSRYHIQGVDGEYNLKFVSYDYFYEAVYNKKGILQTENNDPINMGTYNYAAGIPNIHAHESYDVSPYIKWGTTINSPQKGKDVINKGVNLAFINYKKNAKSVYLYRQNLFGMQQGKVR